MKTSRQRILEFIQKRQVVTASELSQALSMTQANARHHLNILKDQGAIEVVGQRPTPGKGRPALLYSPSTQALGDNLDQLSSALLKEALQLISKDDLLQRTARQLAQRAVSPNQNLTQKLYQAVQRLNEMHYHARWEAHADAPRMILGHCPYAAILEEHPEVCQLDAYLLESLLGSDVTQTARLEKGARGMTYCRFQIMQTNR
jgi:predicted ArsR family transcriptional regulator